ncbi:MAG: response regulator [Bacteroidia bacterium]|jgi:CheY-like chemotaxis protein
MTLKKYNSVLVVDDSHLDRIIASKVILFNKLSEKVEVVNSGRQGLDYVESRIDKPGELPDVLFLDIKMPEMDGFEFLEHYATLPGNVHQVCHVYILSSSVDQKDLEKAQKSDWVKGYIIKPLSLEKLEQHFGLT